MGNNQLGLSHYEQTNANKLTKKENFLDEMEEVVPWEPSLYLIEPVYSKANSKAGRPPYQIASMLRIHLIQQWYPLSDPAKE